MNNTKTQLNTWYLKQYERYETILNTKHNMTLNNILDAKYLKYRKLTRTIN